MDAPKEGIDVNEMNIISCKYKKEGKVIKNKLLLISILILISMLITCFTLLGCTKVYVEGEPGHEESPGEEPPPEGEPGHEESPGEEPKQEEPKKISEQEIKERCFHRAQYEIESHSIYTKVVFDTGYDDNFINKVTGYEYTYECGIEFNAWDGNAKSNGHFIWTFVVRYDPESDSCVVEGGTKQSEIFFP